ncbi:unnamed protein product [Amoebophrya sp. A120]|nr:unnamed protein product [Amoebophrya sp. A120]|eukprot:GSA120T00025374001.1
MRTFIRAAGVAYATVRFAAASMNCDDEFEPYCMKDLPQGYTNLDLGKCFRNIPADKRSEGCNKWVTFHEQCKEEFAGERCMGSAWTPDAEICVKSWTPRNEITAPCGEMLPPEEKNEEAELSPAAKKRKEERRKIREEAAARMRDEQSGGSKKTKKKKGSKKKKSKKTDKSEL